ncbi:MAG: hypothetical protein U5K72_18270 [Balneolaceae bacterium]|nr:hypothetical protein [Balneolaceae bacterium]
MADACRLTNGGILQEEVLYKQVDSSPPPKSSWTSIILELINPEKKYSAIVFYFGGGWVGGSINQFEPHARYFSRRGMVAFLVDYRVYNMISSDILHCLLGGG